MKVTKDFVKALNRKKGELRVSDSEIARETGLSLATVNKLLKGKNKVVHDKTFNILSNWLFERI